MGSEALPLHSNGIFKNLPTFSPEIQGLTAIVTGANGISGFFTMRVLLENPHRWHKIWTLSRSPPPKEMMDLLRPEQRDRVEHIPVDFLGKPGDIADALKAKGVTADAVFFYSYLQPKTTIKGSHPWANAQELADVNCRTSSMFEDLGCCSHKTNISLQRLSWGICSMRYHWRTSNPNVSCCRQEQRTTT
jgi:hypothetical protein